MLLKEIVTEKRFAFFERAESWQDAIEKSCLPLVSTGCATPEYAQRIIECVDRIAIVSGGKIAGILPATESSEEFGMLMGSQVK